MLPQKHRHCDPGKTVLVLTPAGRLCTWYRYLVDEWPAREADAYFYRDDLRRFRNGAELLLLALGIPYATWDEPAAITGRAVDLLANGNCWEAMGARPPKGAIRIGLSALSRLLRTVTDHIGWAD